MKKSLILLCLMLLLTACSKQEDTKTEETVAEVFNTEVIEHTANETPPTSSEMNEETSSISLGDILVTEFSQEESTSEPISESSESSSESGLQESVVDETISVSSNIDETRVEESKRIMLNNREPSSFENDVWKYELKDSDFLLTVDSFQDVTFISGASKELSSYPGTIEAVSQYQYDVKEMIILFYRQATESTANQLTWFEVGVKQLTPDVYKEQMDVYEKDKQRMRVELYWDKLYNKPYTVSFSMIEGTEGEIIEDN